MNPITIRPFEISDWQRFRDFRLAALAAAPGMFSSSHQRELLQTPEAWQHTIKGNDHQVFGLFDGERLIGITAAFAWREDPTRRTAILAMSFIQPDYRRRGLSRMLYQARLDWIRAQPQFDRVVTSHRLSNEASRRANQRFGFVETHRKHRIWPDGVDEIEVFYEIILEHRARSVS
jgi:RimJ/RimL family protein N-acetyltransferase